VKNNSCKNCKVHIDKRVELACNHSICKSCLITYALKEFASNRLYSHCCICVPCNKIRQVKSITLDCGCEWNDFSEQKE
jgi:hypothetical protein